MPEQDSEFSLFPAETLYSLTQPRSFSNSGTSHDPHAWVQTQGPYYPYMFRLAYRCGHPDETIIVKVDEIRETIQHHVFHSTRGVDSADIGPRAKYNLIFSALECTQCKTKGAIELMHRRNMERGLYGTNTRHDGFLEALERFKMTKMSRRTNLHDRIRDEGVYDTGLRVPKIKGNHMPTLCGDLRAETEHYPENGRRWSAESRISRHVRGSIEEASTASWPQIRVKRARTRMQKQNKNPQGSQASNLGSPISETYEEVLETRALAQAFRDGPPVVKARRHSNDQPYGLDYAHARFRDQIPEEAIEDSLPEGEGRRPSAAVLQRMGNVFRRTASLRSRPSNSNTASLATFGLALSGPPLGYIRRP